MAVYKIFPTQDTTLYSLWPELNSGLDEIIETNLDVNYPTLPAPNASRILIQFSDSEIADVINNKISGSAWTANLKCFVADVTGLNTDTYLDTYPISQSWNNGTGKLSNSPETQDGASWKWRTYEGGSEWLTSSFAAGSTGSYSTVNGGATWYVTQSLSASQTFSMYGDKDISLNVKNIVSAWYSSSIPNDGFIIKQRIEFTDDIDVQPQLKYFSIDTHTIYPPCLEFKWVDYVFNTGSSTATIINTNQLVTSIANNPGVFYSGSINKFRVNVRPEYPARTFQTSSLYTTNYYLPTASYYAIKDLDTNEFVVDFDSTYTQISADVSGSYFTLNMNGMQTERYYSILIKTTIDGSTQVIDNKQYFKIING